MGAACIIAWEAIWYSFVTGRSLVVAENYSVINACALLMNFKLAYDKQKRRKPYDVKAWSAAAAGTA